MCLVQLCQVMLHVVGGAYKNHPAVGSCWRVIVQDNFGAIWTLCSSMYLLKKLWNDRKVGVCF